MQSDSRSETSAWLTHLLGSASEHAVVFLDPGGHIVAWLGAAERMFGYRKSEALRLDLGDLFTEDDRRLRLDLQELAVASALGRSEDERWHVRKDGSLFWASGVVAAIRNSQGGIDAFCKVLRDRSDLRQRLDTLQNRLQALQQDNERKSRVLASVSHHLRTVLESEENAASHALSEPVSDKRSADHARRLAELVTMLEDAEKPDPALVPKPHLRARSIVLQDELEACVKRLHPSARASGQHIRLMVPSTAIRISADPASLGEMMQALLAHAIRQNRSGGDIHVTASVEALCAVVRVVDDGAGISGKRLSRLMLLLTGAGTQAEAEDPDAELATVHELATIHGGSVEVRTAGTGKGSMLCLRLPIAAS